MRSQRNTCVVVGRVGELHEGAGKDQVDFGHAAILVSPARSVRPVALEPCAWASSTSAPTPGTCSWWTPTAAPRRCRPTPTRSRCGSPSTSTRTARSAPTGVDALTAFTAQALVVAEDKGCEEMLGFATSAVRDARQLRGGAGPRRGAHRRRASRSCSGEDEARLTFLAVRRWFGWSAGRLAVFDIGGGSLEIAGGRRRGARRGLVAAAGRGPAGPRAGFADARPTTRRSAQLRRTIRAEIARDAGNLLRAGAPDRAAATSKTFRSLARICGAAPSGEGRWCRRVLRARRPARVDAQARRDDAPSELAELPGVSPSRTHQIVPGALVAEAVHGHLRARGAEICPWALREGVILERLDQIPRAAADEADR